MEIYKIRFMDCCLVFDSFLTFAHHTTNHVLICLFSNSFITLTWFSHLSIFLFYEFFSLYSPATFTEKFLENSHTGGEVKGLGRRKEDRRDERKLSPADDKTPQARGWRDWELTTPLATPEWALEIELCTIWKNCRSFHPIKSAILSTIPTAFV